MGELVRWQDSAALFLAFPFFAAFLSPSLVPIACCEFCRSAAADRPTERATDTTRILGTYPISMAGMGGNSLPPSRPRPRRPRPSLAAPPEPPFSLNGRYITRKQCHHGRRNSAVPEGRKFHRKGLRDSGFFLHVGEFTLWNRHEILVFRCC